VTYDVYVSVRNMLASNQDLYSKRFKLNCYHIGTERTCMETEERELRIRLTKVLADVQVQTAGIFGFAALGVTLFVLGWQAYMAVVPADFIIPQYVVNLCGIPLLVAAPISLLAALVSLLRLRLTIKDMNALR